MIFFERCTDYIGVKKLRQAVHCRRAVTNLQVRSVDAEWQQWWPEDQARAADAWLETLSPSWHLAQAKGSELHHAVLAQKKRKQGRDSSIPQQASFSKQT